MRRLITLALSGATAAVAGLLWSTGEPPARPRAARELPIRAGGAEPWVANPFARPDHGTPRPHHGVTGVPRGSRDENEPPTVPPGHTVVRVLDLHGCPVAGAAIRTFNKGTFRTDRGGWAHIPPLPGDMGSPRMSRVLRTVTVRVPGYVPVRKELIQAQVPWPVTGEPARGRIRLEERGAKLAAQFVDPRGAPVAGLTVDFERALFAGHFRLLTDADGRIVTNEAPPRACTFTLWSTVWMARERHLRPGREQKIILHRFARLKGHIRPGGRDLRVERDTGEAVRVGRDGGFDFACLPGRVTLLCRERGLVLGTFHLAPGERRTGVEIALPGAEPAVAPGTHLCQNR